MENKRHGLKQELKIVFSPELNEELKYCFYPEQLEKIIFRPLILDETRWQCSCGSVCEGDCCPVCGMQKNLAFGKINAMYLEKHRKERLAMMSTLVKPAKKPKKSLGGRLSVIVAVILIAALAVAAIALIATRGEEKPVDGTVDPGTSESAPAVTSGGETDPISSGDDSSSSDPSSESIASPETTTDAPETTETPETTTDAPETTTEAPETTTQAPETTTAAPETTTQAPETTAAPAVTAPAPSANLPTPESYEPSVGNATMGGKVYSAEKQDYVVLNGSLKEYGKDGTAVRTLKDSGVSLVSGEGQTLYFALKEGVYALDLSTGREDKLAIEGEVDRMTAVHGALYYHSKTDNALYRYADGKSALLASGRVYALEASAGKVYFSTSDGLFRVKDGSADAENINPAGGQCSSIC